jgi:hypothetical protein
MTVPPSINKIKQRISERSLAMHKLIVFHSGNPG